MKYPDDSRNYEFSCYSVFDTFSITAHLTAENIIQFLPNGLEFFDAFSSAVTKVQELLESDIRNNNPTNDFVDFFDNDTTVKKLVDSLSGSSDIKVFQEKSKVTPEELTKLASLEKSLIDLKKVDVAKKVKGLRKIQEQLGELKEEFETLNEYFSATEIGKLKKLIHDYLHNKQLSASEGLAQFKTENIGSIGSDEWKELLIAAKAFAEIQGAYPMINQQFVENEAAGYTFINREEDMGDEGLRKAKQSYYPAFLQEKGIVTLKQQ